MNIDNFHTALHNAGSEESLLAALRTLSESPLDLAEQAEKGLFSPWEPWNPGPLGGGS